jgi:phospholipase/lecithinase/hemolysin
MKKNSQTTDSTMTYTFYCAQLHGEQTKQKLTETGTRRAHMTMDRYKCSGWLFVTLDGNDLTTAGVRITHYQCHPPYTDISISEDVAKDIEQLKNLTAGKVSVILVQRVQG